MSISDGDHIDPSPSLARLIEQIQAVDAFERSAQDAIDEFEDDDDDGKIRERVVLSDVFSDTVVTEPEDIETPITELREEVEDLLDQEGEVEVRFK